MITLKEPTEFEWDKSNQDKNWLKHNVTTKEAEEVFLCKNKKIAQDPLHSVQEQRYLIVGLTKSARALFVVFALRDGKVRVISARDLNKKERFLLNK